MDCYVTLFREILMSSFSWRMMICLAACGCLALPMTDTVHGQDQPKAAAPGQVDYLRDIKPIFLQHCTACHGGLKQNAKLRLDTAAAMKRGGDSGPGLIPGNPAESFLLEVLTGDAGFRMPPEGKGTPPDAAHIALIRKWIEQGAKAPADETPQEDPRAHWSYQSPGTPAIPVPKSKDWQQHPIDTFIALQHEKHGLEPAPLAEPQVLLRRVYLDLVGYPPARQQLIAFVKDPSQQHYEQIVDRLLASPQYGERWGRHWMDVWRYSDWYGRRPSNEIRYSQRHIWRWRNWIIDSLNADKGYDQMLTEMLAGDELAPTDNSVLAATGFLGRNWYKFDKNTWLFETVEQTSRGFLGITMRCARCHDHKYDPITQKDYYQFRAFFEPHAFRTDKINPLAKTEVDNGKAAVLTDGLARAYDKDLDTPTYLFQRGDDRSPDKEHPLVPAVPGSLGNSKLSITPIQLPISSYMPELQESYRKIIEAQAKTMIDKANEDFEKSQKLVSQLTMELADLPADPKDASEPAKPFLVEDFTSLDAKQWKVQSGTWEVKNGHLTQTAVTSFATIVSLQDHPRNFVARARYRKLQPGTYRSVGFSFDHVPGVSTQDVYTSRTDGKPAGGVQAFHRIKGKQTYPQDGITTGKFEVGDLIDLEFRVRERNLTIKLNGELRLEYTLPLERQKGKFCVWNHTGNCEFHSLEIKPLTRSPADLQMALGAAKHGIRIAAKQNELAAAKLQEQITQWQAERVRLGVTAGDVQQAAITAHQARLQQAVIEAQIALLKATRLVELAATDKNKQQQAMAEKKLRDDMAARDQADGTYTKFKATYPTTSTGRRTALARWMTQATNPRTSRIAVNHIWLRHFGEALVPSVDNFGLSGKKPSHPQLLDWLANQLADNGWRMKPIHRLMVTSRTYRLASRTENSGNPNLEEDPENRYLWRMNWHRMEAEAVRDSLLAVAGKLDLTVGGPDLAEAEGQTSRRRSLYFRTTPDNQMQMLTLFDQANPTECYRRRESVIPQQALALSNGRLAIDMSRLLATELSKQVGTSTEPASQHKFIVHAFQRILSRQPTAEETDVCQTFLSQNAQLLGKPDSLKPFPAGKEEPTVAASTDIHQRARENLVHVLFNHNEFVTIR